MRKFGMMITMPVAIAAVCFILYGPIAIAHQPIGPSYYAQLDNMEESQDSLLFRIQDNIYNTFVSSIATGNASPLTELKDNLDAYYEESSIPLIRYWQSYLLYYESIFWLKSEEEKQAKAAINLAIEYLEEIDEKNSEDYALLAMIESFGIQFQPGFKAPITSARVKKYAEKAIAIDAENLRAYYVLASNDFYTPEQYGGMQKAEEFLLKAVSLPEQAIENPFLPSWGKDLCYEMLIRFYLKKEQMAEAKATYKEAIEAYPDNYMINSLAAELLAAE